MIKKAVITFALISVAILAAYRSDTKGSIQVYPSVSESIRNKFISDAGIFAQCTKELQASLALVDSASAISRSRQVYLECRRAYKSMEYLVEYFAPGTAVMINGANIPKEEETEGNEVIIQPQGLQVIEESLFSNAPWQDIQLLRGECARLSGIGNRLITMAGECHPTDAQLLEAVQKEIIRIYALGLAGFDSPAANNSLPEAATALKSARECISLYLPFCADRKLRQRLERLLNGAEKMLASANDFDSFDRLAFIKDAADPLYRQLALLEAELGIEREPLPDVLNQNGQSLWSAQSWNPYYFSDDPLASHSAQTAELGRMLFFDPVLSGNGQRSCGSCHKPNQAFTDGYTPATAFDGKTTVTRNTPTLINTALQSGYFYDSRVNTLEEQARAVTQNPDEMHGNFEENIHRIRQSREYRNLFRAAFEGTVDTAITSEGIRRALAAYQRGLIGLDSRMDRYIRGERGGLLTASENKGFNLFMGKAACGTCHFAPLFGGVVPPNYQETELENIGVPSTPDTVNAKIDTDPGRFNVSGRNMKRHMFKTMTVRNAERTAPYMHNGVFTSLEQVLDFYNRGGGAGIGAHSSNQTLPPAPLNLTKQEQADIIAFLKALTDQKKFPGRPDRLPSFPEQSPWAKRAIGGKY